MSARDDAIDRLLLQRSVEEALYHEANLLDTRSFDAWLDMLTEDMRYFMPLISNVKFGRWDQEAATGKLDAAWFDEGKDTLRKRVQQIMTGLHWSEEPISRVSHLVTNVQILDGVSTVNDGDEVSVNCRFLLYRNRMESETDILVGKRHDILRREEGAWKIASRKILLDQNVLQAKNLTMFV